MVKIMSKPGGVMDFHFQVYNLPIVLDARGYSELLENAILDPKLHFPENIENIVNEWRNKIW